MRPLGARARREAQELADFRRAVLDRSGGRCDRCQQRAGRLEAHHIHPRSRGGGHELENGAALCWPCHIRIHDHSADDWEDWIR